jgi:integrase
MSKLSCGLAIPGVTEKDGRYYKIIRNRWHGLSRIDEGVPALYRALYELDPAKPHSIGDLIRAYRAIGMDELRPATRSDYLRILIRLDHHFGKMTIPALRPSHVAVFLEKRKKAGRGATRANRERAVLSSVFEFGLRQDGWGIEANPCRGIRRNKERPRKRHVKDPEFLEVFEASPEPFQDLLAAGFLSGTRETDIVAWSVSQHWKPHGIVYVESKTGKEHTVEWSKAFAFFVERARRRTIERNPDSDLIFTNRHGQPWTVWAINSQMARLGRPWAFRDLRAKAQTDSEHPVLGHAAAMEKVYRKALRTRPVR